MPADKLDGAGNLRAALERIVAGMPACNSDYGCHVVHFDGEGRELGIEQVDPLAVLSSIEDIARAALDAPLPECGTNNAAPQELPAVNSASRQDAASSTHPGAVGRSDIGTEKDAVAPVRDSAKYPAVAAPTPRTEAAWDKQVNDLSGGSAQDYERAWYAMREIARQLERDLAAANRSLDWCGQQIAACEKYVKSGETIQQAMERNWQDSQNALGLFAKERLKCERLERESADMTKNWQGACIDLGNLQMQKTKDEESVLGTPVSTTQRCEAHWVASTSGPGETTNWCPLCRASVPPGHCYRSLTSTVALSATQEHKLPLDYYADPRADE